MFVCKVEWMALNFVMKTSCRPMQNLLPHICFSHEARAYLSSANRQLKVQIRAGQRFAEFSQSAYANAKTFVLFKVQPA
jgi:hypothetical protein